MTLVDTETGEVVELLDVDEANDIVQRINGTTADLLDLIERAWKGRAWIALGYKDWADLCDCEIDIPKLDRETRGEMVHALRSAGMSTRAIASATDTSVGTVSRDLGAGVPNGTPASSVIGQDGKTYPATTTTTERESRSTTTKTEPTAKQAHDDLQATSETTWADVVERYPNAAEVPAKDREGIRRAFVQLQTMTGPEKVKREASFLNAIDTALLTDEERAERRNNPTEVRHLKCKACGRPFGGPDA